MNLGKYLGKFSFVRFEICTKYYVNREIDEGAALNGYFDK